MGISKLSDETLAFIAESPISERIPIELPTNTFIGLPRVTTPNTPKDENVGKKVLLSTTENNQIIGIGTYTGNVEDKVQVVSFDLQKEFTVEKIIFDKADLYNQRPMQAARIADFETFVTQVRKKLPMITSL